ncbi:MAG: permease-like cell division protein FtsX [Actinomycetes bacterium]
MRRFGLTMREVGHGLRREMTMTIAVILTIAVSLTLFGTGLLVWRQVDAMKGYWYDRVEVSVFLCGQSSDPVLCPGGAVTDVQRAAIKAKLDGLTGVVETVYYESQDQAYERFKEQFKNSPIVNNVSPQSMPESFRVKLTNPELFAEVATSLKGMPGLEQVQDQKKLLERFFSLLTGFQTIALGVAGAMLLVTVLLVVNTMRVSALSRRREIGIMKLVGASNGYIMLPFVLEAGVAAIIGGALAVGALAAEKYYLVDRVLEPSFRFAAVGNVDATEVAQVMVGVFLTGIVLSCGFAFLTVRRHLKV